MTDNEHLIQEMKAVLDFSNMYDMKDVENVKKVLSFVEPNSGNATPIGKQYQLRLKSILVGKNESVCFICRKEPSHDGLICDACMAKFSGGKTCFYDQRINIDEAFSEVILGEFPEEKNIQENLEADQINTEVPAEIDAANDDADPITWDAIKTKGKTLFGKAIKWEREQRVKLAIKKAYHDEEEKRKPHTHKVKHVNPMSAVDKQTIDLLEAQGLAESAKWRANGCKGVDPGWAFAGKISEIEQKYIWYEEVTEPPEVDPCTPIFVDEEAIRKRIMKE